MAVMNLSIGIVGLPNVGKSTLFNALLKKQVANVSNYPFCTIEPNVGVVEVPNERLPVLALIVETEKIVPAAVEFYDIAGLVKGASQGEGLGNKFLSHIREVGAVIHVVRLFENKDIIRLSNIPHPADDIQIIETELIFSDLETLNKQKEPKHNAEKEEKELYRVVQLVKSELNKGIPARKIKINDEEKSIIKPLNLLTIKPVLFVFNVSEEQLERKEKTDEYIKSLIMQGTGSTDSTDFNYLCFNAKLENDILTLSEPEQKEYLKQYHLEDTGLNRLIKKAYEMLGLISFLTAGKKEVRAWTITKGTYAPQAAGVIHTDFEKHFIKVDVIPYPEFVSSCGWIKARELGKVQSAGKDYVMKDGDVVEFKIGNTN